MPSPLDVAWVLLKDDPQYPYGSDEEGWHNDSQFGGESFISPISEDTTLGEGIVTCPKCGSKTGVYWKYNQHTPQVLDAGCRGHQELGDALTAWYDNEYEEIHDAFPEGLGESGMPTADSPKSPEELLENKGEPMSLAWVLLKYRAYEGGQQSPLAIQGWGDPMPPAPKGTGGVKMIPCRLCEQPEFEDELSPDGVCRSCTKRITQPAPPKEFVPSASLMSEVQDRQR